MNLNGLEIEVRRSNRRKTLSINIERDGSVNVIIPNDLEETKLFELLKSKEYKIHKQISINKELNKEKIDRKYVAGQSFLYLGKSYNLKIEENQDVPIKLLNGKFLLSTNAISKAEDHFIKFYKKNGKAILDKRITIFKEQVNAKPKSVKIIDLKTRWASCTPTGNLNFHWKIFMAPLSIIDYLIVHELMHLKHPNHSRAFWDDVSILMPKYQEYENWLKLNGVKLTLTNNY